MVHKQNLLGLDVGEKRIGLAKADSSVKIAFPLTTINVDGTEKAKIDQLIKTEKIDCVVVGYPRNQSGEPTQQTQFVIDFVNKLDLELPVEYCDESLTSVKAEEILNQHNRPFQKGDVDSLAASLILQDYIERIR